MALFMISYDYHKIRNYQPLYDLLNRWNAARLLESLWLVELNAGAMAVRDAVKSVADADDAFAVIELEPSSGWATTAGVFTTGTDWLERHMPQEVSAARRAFPGAPLPSRRGSQPGW